MTKEYTIDIPTNLLVGHFFFIKASALGGATTISSYIRFAVVCGSETITTTSVTDTVVFSRGII
jgi:hypothetical protein